MALSLKAPEADALARQVARLTGEGRQPGLDILRDFLPGAQIETVPLSPDNVEFAIVVATETRSDLPPDWISNRRSELQATTEALLGDADALSERQVELQCRVDESYSQRSGAGSIG